MGNCGSTSASDMTHSIKVKTGDKKGAGTDGNIYFSMSYGNNKWTDEQLLDTKWKNDFQQGSTDVFQVKCPKPVKITDICIRRDETSPDDDWFLEMVTISCLVTKEESVFPVHRWIHSSSRLCLSEFDCSLPCDDKNLEQRNKELSYKQELYKLKSNIEGAPLQIESLPNDERFSNEYQWDLDSSKMKLFALTKYIDLTTPEFENLEDFEQIYRGNALPKPYGAENWRSDSEFGNQRLAGCNPVMIQLCLSLPDKFPVTAAMVEPFLEGKSLQEALEKKKLYILDLTYLKGMECTDGRELCGPIGLFYSQNSGDFVPIAIQLMPEPGEDNPIFLPSDPEYTWLAAKMWFNLADASHHQSVTHLGLTHLVMETVAVTSHRQLSPSHPVFRLLAPHFLYLLAINTAAVNKLVSKDGWVDNTMQIGRIGMFNIIKSNWADWNIKTHGSLVADLKRRGVDDAKALPNYHYRDDALLLWNALQKYVGSVTNGYYTSPDKLASDAEIQAWVRELCAANVKGLPQTFTKNEEVVEAVTAFIFIGSVGHAAANFCQYDEYGFPPNYPAKLIGERPKDKTPLTEKYIVNCLPSKKETLSVLIVTKLLSSRGTNALTDFEMTYAYDPISLNALNELKSDLAEISKTIDSRNAARSKKYPYLHPSEIPNAISI